MIDSLRDLLLGLEALGPRTAFVDRVRFRSRRHAYGEVIGKARRVAAVLARRGVEPGDRVLLGGPQGAEWATLFYGIVLRGAVAVPLPTEAPEPLVARAREQTAARLALGTGGGLGLTCVLAGGGGPDPDAIAPVPSEQSLLEVVYTSGTTGSPRGVRITHGNLLANLRPLGIEIERYRLALSLVGPLRFLHLVPLDHLFGQVMALFVPQLTGGTVVFETSSPRRVVRAAGDLGAHVLVCVPQQLAALGTHVCARTGLEAGRVLEGREEPFAGRWWRHRAVHVLLGPRLLAAIVGGAALPAATEELWRRLGYAVIAGYGLTETAPVVAVQHPLRARKGSVGRALAGVEVRIAPDGEILVRGANVTPGYLGDEAGTRELLQDDGWLRTGDRGRLEADGSLVILGRKKDLIVTPDGQNVAPEPIEEELERDPRVREAAVVARDVEGRSLVHAVLVLEEAGEGGAEAAGVVAGANRRLPPRLRIQSWSLDPGPLPRTATGKLRRAEIRERPGAGALPRAPGAPPGEVQAALARLRGVEGAGEGVRLEEDLGLGSLDRLELLVEIEARSRRSFDEAGVSAARTVGDLERLVASRTATGERAAAPAPASRPLFPRWPASAPLRRLRRLLLPFVLGPLQRLFLRVEVRGVERLAGLEAPFLLVANHQSALDAGPLLAALPARLRYRVAPLMATGAFERWLRPAAGEDPGALAGRLADGLGLFLARALFGAFLLPTGPELVDALAHAGARVDQGESLLLFPEGARSRDGRMGPFRPGAGVLVRELELPVVPARIEGMTRLHPPGAYLPRPGTVKVELGRPIDLAALAGLDAVEITRRLEALYAGEPGAGFGSRVGS